MWCLRSICLYVCVSVCLCVRVFEWKKYGWCILLNIFVPSPFHIHTYTGDFESMSPFVICHCNEQHNNQVLRSRCSHWYALWNLWFLFQTSVFILDETTFHITSIRSVKPLDFLSQQLTARESNKDGFIAITYMDQRKKVVILKFGKETLRPRTLNN